MAVNALNNDVITDFDTDDIIDFQFNDGVSVPGQLLCNSFIGAAAFSGVAGQYRYAISGSQTLVQIDTDGDAAADRTLTIANGTFVIAETSTGSNVLRLAGLVITGTNSADTLNGTIGHDIMSGNNGNDTLNGGLGNDALNGGNGIDTATYAGLAAGVNVNLANAAAQDTIGGGIDTLASIENLTGTSQGDVLTGNAGNNTLIGGDGDDTLNGAAGDDILNGGNGIGTASYAFAGSAVTVSLAISGSQKTGGAGSDTLIAIESLVGSDFADTLKGGTGANRIDGGAGNDRITGGGGGDQLFGGSGNDTFVFLALGDSLLAGQDTIFDFAGGGIPGGDRIDLSAIDAVPGGRDNAFTFINSAAFSGVAGQLRFDTTTSPGYTLVQGDTNGDGVADFQMQLQWSDLSSQIILNAQDFVL